MLLSSKIADCDIFEALTLFPIWKLRSWDMSLRQLRRHVKAVSLLAVGR